MLQNEIWEDIKGYESYYQVSDLGRVKSLSRTTSHGHNKKERILIPGKTGSGYASVNLWKDSKRHNFSVHRLVAEAFIPNRCNLPEVNHKDGNKEFNFKTNLEWTTPSKNIQHSYDELGRKAAHGEAQGHAKLTEADILQIRDSTLTHKELAKIFNVVRQQISKIKSRQCWKHI